MKAFFILHYLKFFFKIATLKGDNNMLTKIVDEYYYLKGIVHGGSFSFIDAKNLLTIVVRTNENKYLRYYNVDLLDLEHKENKLYLHDIENGYSEPIDNNIIKTITVLPGR